MYPNLGFNSISKATPGIFMRGPIRNAFDAGKSITRASGRGLGLEIETFLGPVKWHPAVRRLPFGAQKKSTFQGPTPLPLAQVMGLPASKALCTGRSIN
jgi:hypothetical protein